MTQHLRASPFFQFVTFLNAGWDRAGPFGAAESVALCCCCLDRPVCLMPFHIRSAKWLRAHKMRHINCNVFSFLEKIWASSVLLWAVSKIGHTFHLLWVAQHKFRYHKSTWAPYLSHFLKVVRLTSFIVSSICFFFSNMYFPFSHLCYFPILIHYIRKS